jgi:CRP-like cAMP-binding protein
MKGSLQFPELMKSSLFQDLPADFRADFLDHCSIRAVDEATVILSQDDRLEGMYLIAYGHVEISYLSPDGTVSIIHHARVGETFGEIEALSDRTCVATCTAGANTTLLFYPTPLLFESVRNVVFLRNIMRLTYDRLARDNQSKYVDQHFSVERRLCAYLLKLSQKSAEITKSQSYIASVAGCSRQTVNKELGALRAQGVILVEKGTIRILDRGALVARVETPDGRQSAGFADFG